MMALTLNHPLIIFVLALCAYRASVPIVALPIGPPDPSMCEPQVQSSGGYTLNCCPFPTTAAIVDFTPPPPSSPLRVRRPAHSLSRSHIRKYEKATRLMKKLPPTHPWSLTQQANIHCAYCAGTYAQPSHPTLPIHVHASWLFLPFHRCYLYFHERILGKLIGDDSFALPFWNWDSPDSMTIPPAFAEPSSTLYNSLRDKLHQPPNMTDLEYNGTEAMLSRDGYVARNYQAMYRDIVSGARTAELFYGSLYRAGDKPFTGPGSLERGPHNTVHVWVGGDLLSVEVTGLDPLFFPHHANGDRLWELWKGLQAGEDGRAKGFDDPDWLDASFLFWDENLRLVRIKVRDCLDTKRSLRYTYENVHVPWLNFRPEAEEVERSVVAFSTPVFPIQLRSTAVSVGVSREAGRAMREEGEEVLVIDEIELDGSCAGYVRFDVYVGTKIGRMSVGAFSRLPKGGKRPATGMTTKVRFGLREVLEEIGAVEEESVVVSLVPCKESSCVVKVGDLRIEYV